MTESEWLDHYKRRLMDQAGLSESQAEDCAKADTFAVLSEGFEDEPEEAADSEMSYWDGE